MFTLMAPLDDRKDEGRILNIWMEIGDGIIEAISKSKNAIGEMSKDKGVRQNFITIV